MQPYPNPNYYTQPMFNNVYQSQFQTQNQFNLMGKMVDSIDAVRVMDIPMDGNIYYFPKADGSEIYTKRWNANGTTTIGSFCPIKPLEEEKANNSTLNDNKGENEAILNEIRGVMSEIRTLNDKINGFSVQKSTRKAVKNESESND